MSLLSIGILGLCLSAPQEPAATPPAARTHAIQDAERWLTAAEMCYWAALEDYGSPDLLRRGQEYLARLDDLEEPVAVKRRDELRANIEAQLDMGHDTLRGVFPGYRVLREGIGPEVLVDDPWVVSTVNATEAASSLLNGALRTHAQFDLRGRALFQHGGDERLEAAESRPDLLNEAFYVLSGNPRVWIDPVLEPEAADGSDVAPSNVSLEVVLDDSGTEPPLFAATVTAELSVDGAPAGEKVRAFGFAHDHRPDLRILAFWFTGLLLAALLPALKRSWQRRRLLQQELSAAAGAFALGIGVTGVLLHTFRELLPSPDELVATALWGPLLLAVASSAGPLIALGLAPGRLKEFIPDGLQHWTERDLGAWPSVVGGGTLIFGSMALELGSMRTLPIALLWLLAQHHGTTLVDRGAHMGTAGGRKIFGALFLALALGIASVPLEDWNPAAISWALGGMALLFVALGLGVDAVAALLTPAASLALLAGATLPILALGVAPFALGLRKRAGRASGGVDADLEDASLTLNGRLERLESGRGIILDLHREQIGSAGTRAPWRHVTFIGGTGEDRRFLAEQGAAALAEDGRPSTLRLTRDSADPFEAFRSILPKRGARLGLALTQGLANLSPFELGEAPTEDGPDELAKELSKWIAEGGAPSALALTGSMPPDLEGALRTARIQFTSHPGDARITVLQSAIPAGSEEDQPLPGSITIDLGQEATEARRLHEDFLVHGLGLSAELSEIILEETAGEGAGLHDLVAVLTDLAEAGEYLDPAMTGPIPRPPAVLEGEFRGQVRASLRGAQQELSEEVGELTEEQRRALQVGALLGPSFDVGIVAEVLECSPNAVSHSLSSCEELVDDPEQDGFLRFREPSLMRHLLQEQRIAGERGTFRWCQGALHDLRSVAGALVARLEQDDIDTTGEALGALRVLRLALEHGGDPRRSRELLRRALAPLLEQPDRFNARKRVTLDLVSFFLDRGLLSPDLELALHRERLVWEYGTARTQDLPRSSMEAAERFLAMHGETLERDAVARLELEIATRRIDIEAGPDDDPLPLLESLLEDSSDLALKARALYERARFQWRKIKSQEDPNNDYPGVLESLSDACELAKEAGDDKVLARALRQKAASLSIPPRGTPRSALHEQVALLEESLAIELRRGDLESQAVIHGTLGRAFLYDTNVAPENEAAQMERAIESLRCNISLSAEIGSVEGQIRAATQAAQAEWKREGWQEASAYLTEARKTLEALVGDGASGDMSFIVAGQAAEAVRSGDHDALAVLQPDIDQARETLPGGTLGYLRSWYEPHLNDVFPA